MSARDSALEHRRHPLLKPVLALHDRIRDAVVSACERQSLDASAHVSSRGADDVSFAIDRVAVNILEEGLSEVAKRAPLVLIAEGLEDGAMTLPRGTPEAKCMWRVIIDPIDGTRGLMYQKRSAWALTGVAPNNGARTRLRDIELAIQTEIPVLKQHLCDQLCAERGRGMSARRLDRFSGAIQPLALRPSSATTTEQGFASIVKFFPGARAKLGAIDDEVLGGIESFEDQYVSTGGQLYELMAGHDRFIADLRPVTGSILCCHPYDICTALIAESLGVILTGADGTPLDAPLDTTSNVAWIGYANAGLRAKLEPKLLAALRAHAGSRDL